MNATEAPKPDLYRTLGVRWNASAASIRRAYRKLATQFHPDRNPGDDDAKAKLAAVQLAYDVLSDADRRRRYDATGDTAPGRTASDATAELMAILGPLLEEVLKQMIETGRDLTGEDLVAKMRNVQGRRVAKLKDDHAAVLANVKRLESIVGRFTVEAGEENLLDSAVRHHHAGCARHAEAIAADLARHERAAAYLKTVKYTHVLRLAKGGATASGSAAAVGGFMYGPFATGSSSMY